MALLSNRMRRQIYALATSEDVITLVRIDHPDWADPLRFASHALQQEIVGDTLRHFTTHDGEEWEHALISAMLPDIEGGGNPGMPIVIDNAGYDASVLIEEDLSRATVDIIAVAKSDPEEVLDQALGFEVADGECQDDRLTLNVALDADDPSEPACAYRMTKNLAPGLFL